MVHGDGQRQAADHQQHVVVQPPVAAHRRAQRVDIDAQHRKRRALLAHARVFLLTGTGRRRGQHQAPDLRCLFRKVVLHRQPAQVLQHGQQIHQLGVVAGRAQPLRHLAGQPHPVEQISKIHGVGLAQRARPGAQRLRRAAHAVQAEHRNGPAHGEDRAAARAHRAAQRRPVHAAQQLKGQAHVLQHGLGQLGITLTLHRRQPGSPRRAARHRRQQARSAHAVQQQQDRPAAGLAFGLEPAGQRTFKGPGIAVALALLPVGGPVDDGAQRLGDR